MQDVEVGVLLLVERWTVNLLMLLISSWGGSRDSYRPCTRSGLGSCPQGVIPEPFFYMLTSCLIPQLSFNFSSVCSMVIPSLAGQQCIWRVCVSGDQAS